jgi:trk system potassium uptake protein
MGQYAVIGLGNFGFHITKALFDEGNEVVALDQDKSLVQSTTPFCTQSMVLDATEKENLRSLGLEGMDGVIVSVGSNLSSSILITLHLHEMGVKRIIVKAIDEDHAKILARIGASEIVHPEKEMALRLAKSLTHPNILDYIPISDEFEIVQISPPREFWGKNLRDLDLRVKYGIQVIAVKETQPNQSTLIPPSTYIIKESDTLIVVGEQKHIKKIRGLKGGK